MKKLVYLLLLVGALLGLPEISYANASQPGIWSAGGAVYTLLYPQDSASYEKVQMLREEIYIQLYQGYAVVKGVYHFKNTSSQTLDFKMGYPVKGLYHGGAVLKNEVYLDSLSQFQIAADGKSIPILKAPSENMLGNLQAFSENWYVWDMHFAENAEQEVIVYFVVNTNDGSIREGYSSQHYNAFIYLLESGSVWHQPIEQGRFYVQLMEGLSMESVHGLSATFAFAYNTEHHLLRGQKTNYTPTPQDNLIITYHERQEQFSPDFAKLSPSLYQKIDALSSENLENLKFVASKTPNPYEVSSSFFAELPLVFKIVLLTIPIVLGGMIVLLLIRWILRRNRRKEKVW